jgi:GT2 family glycosyltransferase
VKLSVVIPTLNRPEYLGVTLSSLLNQTFKEWDLIIVDDSNQSIKQFYLIKGLLNLLHHQGHTFKVIRGNGGGMDAALNLGQSISGAELILRMDDDVWMERDYIRLLYECIIQDSSIGGVGGVCPNVFHTKEKLTKMDPKTESWGGLIIREGGVFKFPEKQSYIHHASEPYEVEHLRGYFLYRKSAVEEVGGFPTDYSQFARREELDTSIRMRMAGYKLMVEPRAICWHLFAMRGGTREIEGGDWVKSPQSKRYIEHDLALFDKKLRGWLKSDKGKRLKIIDLG